MTHLAPLIRGALRDHPLARPFADEVLRVHRRYAAEVVAKNRLCPFLRDVDTGFGVFIVMLDPGPELDVEAAAEAVLAAPTPVVHVVYPCVRPPPNLFERFGARLTQAVKERAAEAPVTATFHPELTGDAKDPYRLVGLLRRAPDPFVQFIPAGLHQGGTVFAGVHGDSIEATPPEEDSAIANFERLKGGRVDEVAAAIAAIHADREQSYARYLAALGRG